MKKIALLTIPLLLLTGCKNNTTKEIKILCPSGAPAFAFYNYAKSANFETSDNPNNIVASMTKASDKTIVVLPIDTGIKAINNGAPYKLAANITFGNFFLCSTGHDANNQLDPGDKVVLFGQGMTPDRLFHYVYGNDYDEGVEYVTAAKDAAACLQKSKNMATGSDIDYVFLAQPAVFGSLKVNENAKVYSNIQELYKEKSGGKELIQASIFIKNTLDYQTALDFLPNIGGAINEVLEDPTIFTQKIEDTEEMQSLFGAKPQIATAVTKNGNGLGLGYKNALANKDNIDAYLSLFSLEKTNEKIYFK
jgi:hypothetical protein